jgi:subtilisin family serine protease
VKWTDAPASQASAEGNAQIGSTVIRNFNAIGWQQVKLPEGMTLAEGIQAYKALGTVLAVEPNLAMSSVPSPVTPSSSHAPTEEVDVLSEEDAVGTGYAARRLHSPVSGLQPIFPNDSRFNAQWYLNKIGATNAWAVTTGTSSVVVAVFDSGINYHHEDLAANMWRNPGEIPGNGIDDDGNGFVDDVHGIDTASDGFGNDSDPMDEGYVESETFRNYHGTACAGIIGAVGNNGRGVAGLNWSIQLMAIRMGTTTPNGLIHIADTIAAFDYVVMMKRRGVNIRVTSHSYSTLPSSTYSQALKDAIDAGGDQGILNVFATGNDGLDLDAVPEYPVRYDSPSIVAVAASDRSDRLAWFSNHGRTGADLAAPGVEIVTTFGPDTDSYISNSSGTSYACPLVAGAAALLLAAKPLLTLDELKAALFGSVDHPTSLRGRLMTGGRLNVARALEYLADPEPPAIVVRAMPSGLRTSTNAAIEVTFNRPMNRVSVESALVISPPVNGTFAWTADNRSFSFHPDVPLESTTTYAVRIAGTAQDETAGTLDGDFDRRSEGSPEDDFRWTFHIEIPNDDFANAQWLTGTSGSVRGDNRYASVELGEPRDRANFGKTLWYRWTAPDSGEWWTFDVTSGTSFDSLLAIYLGDRHDQLNIVVANDNDGSDRASRVSFAATPGTDYSIEVANERWYDPTSVGAFTLSWYPSPPPVLTGVEMSPSQGAPGTRVIFTGTNLTGATTVLFNGANAPVLTTEGDFADRRLAAYVPLEATSGPITVVTPHGNGTSAVLFTALPLDPSPPSIAQITALAATDPATSTPIAVRFDKPVEESSAQAIENYQIDDGEIAISGVVLQADLKTVVLVADPLQEAEDHRLELTHITHRFLPDSVSPALSGIFQANALALELSFDNPADRGANGAGYSHSGELLGEPSLVPGAIGSALHFDGIGAFVDVPHDPVFNITGDMTIAAWIRRDGLGVYSPILAKTDGYGNGWDYELYFPAGANSLAYWSDGLQPSEIRSSGTIANLNWNHVAVTRNGDRITFYINGRASNTTTAAGTLPARPYPVRIGTDGPNYIKDSLFKGQIDEVRLYNRALSAADIQTLSRPRLAIALSGGELLISWPVTGARYTLETSADLDGASWAGVSQSPVTQNAQNKLVLPITVATSFYRLKGQ